MTSSEPTPKARRRLLVPGGPFIVGDAAGAGCDRRARPPRRNLGERRSGRGTAGARGDHGRAKAGSPAAKAGLEANDVITGIDGDTIALAVTRGGKTLTVSATLAVRPASTSA